MEISPPKAQKGNKTIDLVSMEGNKKTLKPRNELKKIIPPTFPMFWGLVTSMHGYLVQVYPMYGMGPPMYPRLVRIQVPKVGITHPSQPMVLSSQANKEIVTMVKAKFNQKVGRQFGNTRRIVIVGSQSQNTMIKTSQQLFINRWQKRRPT